MHFIQTLQIRFNYKLLFFFILLFSISSLHAQKDQSILSGLKLKTEGTNAILYLKDGSFIFGNLVLYNRRGREVSFKTTAEEYWTFDPKKVRRIHTIKKKYRYLNNGQYIQNSGGFPSLKLTTTFHIGLENTSSKKNNHVDFLYRYFVKQKWALGAGLGSHHFSILGQKDMTFVPLYLNATYFLSINKISPYVSVNLGYSFPFVEYSNFNTQQGEDYFGNYFANPEIGISLASRKKLKWFFELGYHIQRTNAHYYKSNIEQFNQPTTFVKEKVSFNRIEFSIGFSF